MDPDEDNLPLNPERGEGPQGIDNVDFTHSYAPPDKGEASRPETSHDIEMAAFPLISEGAQSEDIQGMETDPSVHSQRDESSEGSYSESEYSIEEGCCSEPEWFTTIKTKFNAGFKAFQTCMKPITEGCTKLKKIVVKLFPMIMTIFGILLLGYDQKTDIEIGHTICDMDCTCVWNKNPENTTTKEFKEFGGICEGTGDSKVNHTCYDAFGNEDLIGRYCNPLENAEMCDEIVGWNAFGMRHPRYCIFAISTIVVSNILTSSFLLHRLRQLYVPMLIYLGWHQKGHSWLFKLIYIIMHLFWILQILPHVWIIMTFFICLERWKKERENIVKERKKHWEEAITKGDWDDYELWEQSNRRSKIIFAIFEDTPQLTLHSMFIVNSVVKEERVLVFSGIEYLEYTYYIGAATSALSMALAVTIYKELPNATDKAIQFTSSALAVGSRAFICACYASTISEDFSFQTWTVFLPPATSFVLFIVDKLVNSLLKWVKRPTWNNFIGMVKKIFGACTSAGTICKEVKAPTFTKFIGMVNKISRTFTSIVVSLIFEGNSVESLIPAYTYLAYAVVLRTMWVSEVDSLKTNQVLLTIQFLSMASVLYNLVIVQKEGKHKVRCLIYSLFFLLFLGLFYLWVSKEFKALKDLYFTNKAVENLSEKEEFPKLIKDTLSSLTAMFIFAGITLSVNLILKIASLIRDCFIRALIPDRKRVRNSRQNVTSDIEMTSLHT